MTLHQFHQPGPLSLSGRDELRTTLHPEEAEEQCQHRSNEESFIFVFKHK